MKNQKQHIMTQRKKRAFTELNDRINEKSKLISDMQSIIMDSKSTTNDFLNAAAIQRIARIELMILKQKRNKLINRSSISIAA